MKMKMITGFLAASVAVTTVAPVSAQVAITIERPEVTPKAKMPVTVTPIAGKPIAKPRFHFIRGGEAIPKASSRGWTEFPAITVAQDVTLIAPEETGAWWLLLCDNTTLVARIPFDVFDHMTALELARQRLLRNQGGSGETTPTTTSGPSPAPKGYVRLAKTTDINLADQFDVIVTLPPQPAGGKVELKWGNVQDVPWAEKEKAPDSLDFPASASLEPTGAGPHTLSIIAPYRRAGQFELRLFRGGTLIDVLVVTIKKLDGKELR